MVYWLQCPACGEGSVMSGEGKVFPTFPAGGRIKNLPADVEGAWREVRTAYSVAAYTASEMMCRKILMHIAVGVAGGSSGESFVRYLDDLDRAGYIMTSLRNTVDRVRTRGNVANHELPASTEDDALATLTVTDHLLRGIYELPTTP